MRNPTTGIAACARTVSGHVAAPPRSVMNPRRLIAAPEVPGAVIVSD